MNSVGKGGALSGAFWATSVAAFDSPYELHIFRDRKLIARVNISSHVAIARSPRKRHSFCRISENPENCGCSHFRAAY